MAAERRGRQELPYMATATAPCGAAEARRIWRGREAESARLRQLRQQQPQQQPTQRARDGPSQAAAHPQRLAAAAADEQGAELAALSAGGGGGDGLGVQVRAAATAADDGRSPPPVGLGCQ